ncbi:MAG: dihydrofolate reductase [Lachnospiraceae bacterium]|nr:dihydrofolate reductase [Lachnospiraceae bacterium]
MKCIAAVDRNWAIGCRGRLLASIPEDMRFFRSMTLGKTVVMGRKTLESFPGGKPLKGRRNIVLTGSASYTAEGAEVVHSKAEALEAVRGCPDEEVFIIGGESIYRLFLDECDTAYITKIDREYEADASFPDLDADEKWHIFEEGETRMFEDLPFRFVTYRRSS